MIVQWSPWPNVITGVTDSTSRVALCPDLLCYDQIGEADTWRGRVVRMFFWLLRAWPRTVAS